MRVKLLLPCIVSLLSISSLASAKNWALSVGYNNPPGANLGINLQRYFSNWAVEFGIGSINTTLKSGSVGGDVNFKYLFSSGSFRPYLGAGFGLGIGTNSDGAAAGAGQPFVGGGMLLEGSTLMGYVAGDYLVNSKSIVPVVGIGFNF